MRTRLLVNTINDQDPVVKSLAYELLLLVYKKTYNNRLDAKFEIADFLPYIIRDEPKCTKAQFLANEIKAIDNRLLFYSIFTSLFSTSVEKRQAAFSSLFRDDLFKIGLRFDPKNDLSFNDRRFYERFKNSLPKVPFKDPLDQIWNPEIS